MITYLTTQSFRESIYLKEILPTVILFYGEDSNNIPQFGEVLHLFALAQQQSVGVKFACINLSVYPEIMQEFTNLRHDKNNPLYWASKYKYPFILKYKKGIPISLYNGKLDMQSFILYVLT